MLQPNLNQIAPGTARNCTALHSMQHSNSYVFSTQGTYPSIHAGSHGNRGEHRNDQGKEAMQEVQNGRVMDFRLAWRTRRLVIFRREGENENLIGHRGDGGGDRGAPSFPSFESWSGTWDCVGTTSFTWWHCSFSDTWWSWWLSSSRSLKRPPSWLITSCCRL